MIWIFVLLFLLLAITIKFCKKKILKVGLIFILLIIISYFVLLSIEINRVNNLKEPIFAKENGHMGSMIRYDGLGYTIGLEKNREGIFQSQMTILGYVIAAATT